MTNDEYGKLIKARVKRAQAASFRLSVLIEDLALTEKVDTELHIIAQCIREILLIMFTIARSGHVGSCLSCVDILTALFFFIPLFKGKNIEGHIKPSPLQFILSKGHAAPVLYVIHALKGYVSIDDLLSYRSLGSRLQGHIDSRFYERAEKALHNTISNGPLGQGLSIANGIAIGRRKKLQEHEKIFVLVGDGELQEGQIWEAAMMTAAEHLNNITLIIDKNGLQLDGVTPKLAHKDFFWEKFQLWGWDTITINAHSIGNCIGALLSHQSPRPLAIIAGTVKGKGLYEIEGQRRSHSYRINDTMLKKYLSECAEKINERSRMNE